MKYRAFKSEVREQEEPFRFVDGELIERFLECRGEVQEQIVNELGLGKDLDVEKVTGMVEALRRLR